MAKIAYLRVSTAHQNTGRQEFAMPSDIDKTFEDKASGKNTERPQFQAMLEYIREGDIVYFESFSLFFARPKYRILQNGHAGCCSYKM